MTSSGGERGDWIVVRQLEGMPRRKPGRSRGRRALASRGSLKCGNPANRRVIESTGVCSATEDVRFNYQLTFLPSLTAERRAVPIRKSAARKLDDARSTVLRPVSADPLPAPLFSVGIPRNSTEGASILRATSARFLPDLRFVIEVDGLATIQFI